MMRIEHIEYLLFLLLIPVAAYIFYWFKKKQTAEWSFAISRKDKANFLYGDKPWLSWKSFLFLAISFVFGVFALSNPQGNQNSQEAEIETSDVFIALDISYSMLANDMKPNRLTRAKNLAQQIVEAAEGNRVGLILFAGEAYMFMPLTEDASAAINFIQSANVNMAPTQGTALAATIDLAINSFDKDLESGKSIVILSDGEDHEQAIDQAIKRAQEENVYVFTIAIGTDGGGYITAGNDQYIMDEQGKPVKTVVNEALLKEISDKTKASFFNISKEKNIDIAIKNNIDQMEKQVSKVARFNSFDSYYQYFLMPLLLYALWIILQPLLVFINSKKQTEITNHE